MAEGQVQVELPLMEKGPIPQSTKVLHQQPPPRLCRFFSQGRYCQFGRRCRFLHQHLDYSSSKKASESLSSSKKASESLSSSKKESQSLSSSKKESETLSCETQEQAKVSKLPKAGVTDSGVAKKPPEARQWKYRPRKLCRYFASGYCSLDANCRFLHPATFPPVADVHPASKKSAVRNPESRTPSVRPAVVPKEIKSADITPESARKLRETEISQLLKRFPKDKVIIQEREDGKVTYYRITIEPTDPDWPFDLREMDIMLEFPDNYPLQVFTVQIPEDQVLPSIMGRHVCEASDAWLQAKHATNQLIGKVELLFRPYLHWLDRNMERLFTEGARVLKRDIEAEKAGIEFVPYQQLQEAVNAKCSKEEEETEESSAQEADPLQSFAEDVDDDSDSWISCDDSDEDEPGTGASGGDGMRTVEGGGGEGRRKGTEIRLLGLQMTGGVGTLVAQSIAVTLQCSRCKVTADLSLNGKQPCIAQCERCNSRISGTFLPTIMHQYSSVLGYVDIQGAILKDLILQDCAFMISCLDCSQEEPLQNLSFGITKDMNCLKCHNKLSVSIEASRFQKVERFSGKNIGNKGLNYKKKNVRDPSIQPGKPLPDNGTCRHYRKSCRWLRFPCCGKTYPCDVCHNEAEDHDMDLATRMVCGYCAKEQPYTNGKPCISCGKMMSRNMHSVHWEGGQGCRSKVKMSRKDKQKYKNTVKTISRKSVSKN
ncbi:uncharacterized protein LOC128491221 [Spea bombifrons]|uniref:uncharacterized protein LOC128491221 n=1 Tax=Spea bombifrons TaxID=233779 RepID=UPI00234A460A|nr:uncharacterized protein LOC128491221 [Spea bombifrons]